MLIFVQKCLFSGSVNDTEFIRRAKRYARKTGQECRFEPGRGKGSHGMLSVGSQRTVVKRGEIAKGMLTAMLKQLQIERRDF